MNMSSINIFLVKVDCVCDYVPVVSTVTNFFDLFQKCVILPFTQKETIEANHYYKHLNQKSFARCILLMLPLVGNIIIGIYDFTHKKGDKKSEIGVDQKKTYKDQIELNDVDKVVVSGGCSESSPCQHDMFLFLKDGRKAYIGCGDDIAAIVCNIPLESINPGEKWTGSKAKKHFEEYQGSQSPEAVLKALFSKKEEC